MANSPTATRHGSPRLRTRRSAAPHSRSLRRPQAARRSRRAASTPDAPRDEAGTISFAAAARQRSKPQRRSPSRRSRSTRRRGARSARRPIDAVRATGVDAGIARLDRLGHRLGRSGVAEREACVSASRVATIFSCAESPPARQSRASSVLSSPASGGTTTLRRYGPQRRERQRGQRQLDRRRRRVCPGPRTTACRVRRRCRAGRSPRKTTGAASGQAIFSASGRSRPARVRPPGSSSGRSSRGGRRAGRRARRRSTLPRRAAPRVAAAPQRSRRALAAAALARARALLVGSGTRATGVAVPLVPSAASRRLTRPRGVARGDDVRRIDVDPA